ncbi:MAG: carbohydrate ABC transporter permease [Bacilli bacterium]
MYLLIISVTIVLFVTFLVLKAFEKKPARYGNRIIHTVPENKNMVVGDSADEVIRRERVFRIIKNIVSYTFLGFMALCMIIPFYWMIATSLKTGAEIDLPTPTFIPGLGKFELALSNYPQAIERLNAARLIYNTLVVGIVSTIGTVVTTVMAAFAFSRIKFVGRELIFTIFLATMMIPGEMMVITNYITVTKTAKTLFGVSGIDTYWAMIVPFLISVYYIYLLRQNFKQIPNELYYAAKVDGTSDFKYLIKVMVPIALPTIITISILKLMGSWNAYVWPMMVTRDENMRLITTGLRASFSDSEGRVAQGLQMAATTVVTLPLLFVFIFLRKYIMRGVSRSGIKG